MIIALIWFFSLAGFGLLGFATARHRKLFNLRPLSQRMERSYKVTGFILLAMALFCTTLMSDPVDGILIWFGVLTFSSLFTAAILSVQHSRKKRI